MVIYPLVLVCHSDTNKRSVNKTRSLTDCYMFRLTKVALIRLCIKEGKTQYLHLQFTVCLKICSTRY